MLRRFWKSPLPIVENISFILSWAYWVPVNQKQKIVQVRLKNCNFFFTVAKAKNFLKKKQSLKNAKLIHGANQQTKNEHWEDTNWSKCVFFVPFYSLFLPWRFPFFLELIKSLGTFAVRFLHPEKFEIPKFSLFLKNPKKIFWILSQREEKTAI